MSRANTLSLPWTRGVECVPTYEEATSDSIAIVMRVEATSRCRVEVTCDALNRQYSLTPAPLEGLDKAQRKKAEYDRPVLIRSGSRTVEVSSIVRPKINFKAREPIVRCLGPQGNFDMVLYRGGYTGFTHDGMEYFWQARYHPRVSFSNDSGFRDAVLRKSKPGEISSIVAWYIPGQQHGVLIASHMLNEVDRELTVISLLAILVRVIDVQKKTSTMTEFFSVLTMGES